MMSVNSANSAYASRALAAEVKTVSTSPPSAEQTQAELPPPSYNPSILITLTLEAQAYLALTQR